MKQKILGLDLGTNSIGISVRNTQKGGPITNQIEYFSSIVFPSGVGSEKGKEFSYAAQRTKFRSQRRLHQARRYRIWSTLTVLIDNGLCPLRKEQLDAWRTYDKSKGLKREYPKDAREFEQWVRLDFNNDGIPEYTSPYQLRAELMTRQFDFEDPIERFKLGRALYHIAQRRGFKSSKGETAHEQENMDKGEDVDFTSELQKSEEKKSQGLQKYMEEHNCPTVGCAFYQMEKEGLRVRANEQMQAIRSMYKEEIEQIFTFQKGLDIGSDLYIRLTSKKKGEGCIFYKRPLRSQKGTVGNCTLEKNKPRCPISRPEFEQFRAWSFINNLRFKTKEDSGKPERELPLELRKRLYEDKFIRVSNCKVDDLLKWLKKEDASISELNYDGKTTVMGSPVCAKLKELLGDDWMHAEIEGYNYEELWHICFDADEDENVKDFAMEHLHADGTLVRKMVKLYDAVSPDYASLSLKAIRNILRMLQEGFIYSDAVVLAKLPDMFGDNWEEVKPTIFAEWVSIKNNIEHNRLVCKIANNLIAAYKMLEPEDQFAFRNTDYQLEDKDRKQINTTIIQMLSRKGWSQLSAVEKEQLQTDVSMAYQQFFHSETRNYLPIAHLDDALQDVIKTNFADYLHPSYRARVEQGQSLLYHPSVINMYAPQKAQMIEVEGIVRNIKLLGSPATNVFRNPVVMRVLYQLRNILNDLIKRGIIDESNTGVVVETARELNDANMRAAIVQYQRRREKENATYKEELLRYCPESKITDADIEKVRLWHEQGGGGEHSTGAICLYTGKIINLCQLLNKDNQFEIEHTIPRSISFDDSLANKTICDAQYNSMKNNCFPSQMDNYQEILDRIGPWRKKIDLLKRQISTQKKIAKSADAIEKKNKAIADHRTLEMELRYWQDKVSRFTIQRDDWKDSFRSNQLNDTRIITKYAYHFLKSVFGEVSVQRGDMTANFRKALGIQSIEEKKDRSLHSHHAIDATMLTLIPTNAKRDALLELFYQKEELKKRLEKDSSAAEELASVENKYNQLLSSCDIRGVDALPDFINKNILIHHITKDQTLTPAHRRVRVRGKVLTKDGKEFWKTGDSLRGSLHMETWYGAIASPKRNEDGRMIYDENGKIQVDTNNLTFVVRLPLSYKKTQNDSGFKDWSDLENQIVDKDLFKILKNQYGDMPFEDAIKNGLYMFDGMGRRVNKIRHIRCKIPSVKNPISIKEHTYLSDKEYKQQYWARLGDLCYMCKYQNAEGNKNFYHAYSLYDISKNRQLGVGDIPQIIVSKKGESLNLQCVLRSGTSVLIYNNNLDELIGMPNEFLMSRLYIIAGFENPSRIILVHHLSVKNDSELGKGEAISNFRNLPKKVRCGIATINFLVEGVDFELTSLGIEFK